MDICRSGGEFYCTAGYGAVGHSCHQYLAISVGGGIKYCSCKLSWGKFRKYRAAIVCNIVVIVRYSAVTVVIGGRN